MRTNGEFDTLSALLVEFLSPSDFLFTQTAKDMYESRKKEFEDELIKFYGKKWDEMNILRKNIVDGKVKFQIGIKDGSSIKLLSDEEKDKLPDIATREFLVALTKIPVREFSKPRGRDYFGFCILVGDEGREEWIDPSILRFESKEKLQDGIQEAVRSFKKIAKGRNAQK
jgi:hypothetical protein